MGRSEDGKGGLAHREGIRQKYRSSEVGVARSATDLRSALPRFGRRVGAKFLLGHVSVQTTERYLGWMIAVETSSQSPARLRSMMFRGSPPMESRMQSRLPTRSRGPMIYGSTPWHEDSLPELLTDQMISLRFGRRMERKSHTRSLRTGGFPSAGDRWTAAIPRKRSTRTTPIRLPCQLIGLSTGNTFQCT
jgi:hypothetical protein